MRPTGTHPISKYLFKAIKPFVEGKRVLDLGCGEGRYLSLFSRDSLGIDIDSSCLQACQEKGLNAKYGDINKRLEFADEEFDIVFCAHILEHVESPIGLLREAYRVLKKNSFVIVIVPNEGSLSCLINRDRYFENHPGHIYSFSLDNLTALLEKTQFQVVKVIADPYLAKRAVLGVYPFAFLDALPKFRLLLTQYGVVGRKV